MPPALPETRRPGLVTLVGAGPGDPGLLTRRGAEALAQAEAVVYDHLANLRLLDLAPPTAERHPVGKRAGHAILPQDEINALLVRLGAEGKRVVRLKGGDPYVFGRGGEEVEALAAAGVPFRVVPGVTAGLGVTAYAGLAVTHRASASGVALVTGHGDPSDPDSRVDWGALARFPGTLVVYMGVTRLAALCRHLIEQGRADTTPAALVQSGTLAAQRTVTGTLADLPDRVAAAGLGPPALLVVGAVVARRPALAWFEALPLFGQRIVVTRPAAELEAAASDLEALGAEALGAPMVDILPLDDPAPLDDALRRLDAFDWVVFTSANGVRHFLDRLPAVGRDVRALGHTRLAAIGPATAQELARARLNADLVPSAFRSEDLAEALAPLVRGRRVLLARADRGRTLLRDVLGPIAEVEQVAVYRNADAVALPEAVGRRIEEGSLDWITVTSSAIAARLHALVPDAGRERIRRGEIRLASLSPVTSATIRRLGWPVAAEATEFTWPGLLAALIAAVPGSSRSG